MNFIICIFTFYMYNSLVFLIGFKLKFLVVCTSLSFILVSLFCLCLYYIIVFIIVNTFFKFLSCFFTYFIFICIFHSSPSSYCIFLSFLSLFLFFLSFPTANRSLHKKEYAYFAPPKHRKATFSSASAWASSRSFFIL